MLFQLTSIEEIQFLLYLTVLVLGLQSFLYILYRYLKTKRKKLPLSKSLLIFGLLQIIVGIICCIASILIVLETIRDFDHLRLINIIFFIGAVLLIMGYIFALIGLYAFPSLYKFKGAEENILKLFIINQKNNVCLYGRDFTKDNSDQMHKDYEKVFSVGIIGIASILAAITNTKEENINRIQQEESLILLEYGSNTSFQIIYALIVKKDIKSNIYLLKFIKNQFEYFYKEILSELDTIERSGEQLFTSFDAIIKDAIY